MKIKQLDEILANKIAAGEVIERPANVVKELVENSIDASSSKIDIIIEEGGMNLIEIVDDGLGMDQEDAKLCFSRHATSKITNDQDLFCIQTLGFRGEAIPSIASISHFELKTSDGQSGSTVVYEFGKFIEQKQSDLKRGTKITVTKLFQNVPARLKYVKSVNAEFAHIQNYVERLSLSHPDIAFTLMHNGKVTYKTNGNGQLLEVIHQIYGLSVVKNMLNLKVENDEFEVEGYIGKIEINRASKNHIVTLVNHRIVKNQIAIDAINQAYRKYLADNRYPIAIINIEIDPYLVDVNVHPSKLEVKFSKESELKQLIFDGVSKTLEGVNLTYQAKEEKPVFKPQLDQLDLEIDFRQEVPPLQVQPIERTMPSYIYEEKEEYQDRYHRYQIIGIVLCILSVLPIFIFLNYEFLESIAVCILLFFVSIGCFFLVLAGTYQNALDKILQTGDYTPKQKKNNILKSKISTIYWLVVTAIFLYYTFGKNGNGQMQYSWIIWAIAGVLFGVLMIVIDLINKRRD